MRPTLVSRQHNDSGPIQLRGKSSAARPMSCNNKQTVQKYNCGEQRGPVLHVQERVLVWPEFRRDDANPEYNCMSPNMIQLLELMDQKDSKVVLRQSQPYIQGVIRESFEAEPIKKMFKRFQGCSVSSSSSLQKPQQKRLIVQPSLCSNFFQAMSCCRDSSAVKTPTTQQPITFRGTTDSMEQIVNNFKEIDGKQPRMPLVLLQKIQFVKPEMEQLLKCTLKELQSKQFLSGLSMRILTLKESLKDSHARRNKEESIRSLETAVSLAVRFRAAHMKVLADIAVLAKSAAQGQPENHLEEAVHFDYVSRCVRSLYKKVQKLQSKIKGCLYLRDAQFLDEFTSTADQSLRSLQQCIEHLTQQPTSDQIEQSLSATRCKLSSKQDSFRIYLLRMYCRKHNIPAE